MALYGDPAYPLRVHLVVPYRAADIASVSDEWRLYIHDEEIRKPEKGTRVDHYWRDIFKLQP